MLAPDVWPVVELGVGDIRGGTAQAKWDVSHWDTAGSLWAGSEPSWLDITCDVISVASHVGRERSISRFDPGTCTVVATNSTGWADILHDATNPAALSLRPGRQIRWGVRRGTDPPVWKWRGFIDAHAANYDGQTSDTDTVTLTCIDALGEVGRVALSKVDPPVGAGETATTRIGRILDAAGWRTEWRDVQASSTAMLPTDLDGRAVDQLSQVADTVGGSVYGDIRNWVVFRNRDWQTYPPERPFDAVIGNVDPGTPGHWTPGTPEVLAHLDPTVGTVSTPFTADPAASTATADPTAAATYWRKVGSTAVVGVNTSGTPYPGDLYDLAVTYPTAPTPGPNDALLEPFNNVTAWVRTTGTADAQIVTGRTGTAAGYANLAGSMGYNLAAGAQSDTIIVGFAYRPNPLATTAIVVGLWSDSGATQHTSLATNANGSVSVIRGASSVLATSAAGVIVANTWQYIELQFKLADTGGTAVVRVGGTPVINATGLDTRNAGTKAVYDQVRIVGNPGENRQFDDLYISYGASATFKGNTVIAPGTATVRFDADDYPGTGLSYTDPRGATWTLSAAGAVVPHQPAVPPVWVPGTPADVCPNVFDLRFDRAETTTRAVVNYEGATGAPITVDDTAAQLLYGVETAPEMTDLQSSNTAHLATLAHRIINTQGVGTQPRVQAVTFDAARGDPTVAAMIGADPFVPTLWRVRVVRDGRLLADRAMFVTSVDHELDARTWTLRVGLDDARPWQAAGGRWDGAYWDRALWASVTALRDEAVRLLDTLEVA